MNHIAFLEPKLIKGLSSSPARGGSVWRELGSKEIYSLGDKVPIVNTQVAFTTNSAKPSSVLEDTALCVVVSDLC